MNEIKDLELILHSKIPLIVIETFEEKRALEMLARVAVKRFQTLQTWSITSGLRDSLSYKGNEPPQHDNPDGVLRHLVHIRFSGIVVLCDFHPYLDDVKVQRLIKDIAFDYEHLNCTLVLLSHRIELPIDLNRIAAKFSFSLPTEEQIHALVLDEARNWAKQNKGQRVQTDNNTLSMLVKNLKGLSLSDAQRLVRGAIVDDGAISEYNVKEISKAKFELLNMNGILSYEYETAQFTEVGGLAKLKKWLSERKAAFLEPQPNLDCPKGLLLLGVQGGGKSLAAKAVAGMWHVPLLRLDMGALYNKYIGETERNLRETLKLADHIAPCVLWMDEIEKAVGQTSSADNGTSLRVLASLLTWMAERKSQVFIVATANNIQTLPPELMRKGRIDEIFFVDLPQQSERETIVLIHLEKRNIPLDKVDVALVAKASEGFTGAEIEQALVSTIYRANIGKQNITTLLLIDEIQKTRPISVTRAEDIQTLRTWAKDRAVSAH